MKVFYGAPALPERDTTSEGSVERTTHPIYHPIHHLKVYLSPDSTPAFDQKRLPTVGDPFYFFYFHSLGDILRYEYVTHHTRCARETDHRMKHEHSTFYYNGESILA